MHFVSPKNIENHSRKNTKGGQMMYASDLSQNVFVWCLEREE